MNQYSVMLNIEDKLSIVVGGGEVALRKLKELLQCGAVVRLISPQISDEIKCLKNEFNDSLHLINKTYSSEDLENAYIVISATDNKSVNRMVMEDAKQRGILYNIADDPCNSSFHVNSSQCIGDLKYSISTGGCSPAMASKLKKDFENMLPENIEIVLENLKILREILKTDSEFSDLQSSDRGKLLKRIVNDEELVCTVQSILDRNTLRKFLISII